MGISALRSDLCYLLARAKEAGLMIEVCTYDEKGDPCKVEQVTVENLFSALPVLVINHDPDFKEK